MCNKQTSGLRRYRCKKRGTLAEAIVFQTTQLRPISTASHPMPLSRSNTRGQAFSQILDGSNVFPKVARVITSAANGHKRRRQSIKELEQSLARRRSTSPRQVSIAGRVTDMQEDHHILLTVRVALFERLPRRQYPASGSLDRRARTKSNSLERALFTRLADFVLFPPAMPNDVTPPLAHGTATQTLDTQLTTQLKTARILGRSLSLSANSKPIAKAG